MMMMLMMIDDNSSQNLEVKEVLNLETLSTDASIKRSHDFLLKHVSTRLSLAIMYVDLVGSTRLKYTIIGKQFFIQYST
jgi:hypothetical protein